MIRWLNVKSWSSLFETKSKNRISPLINFSTTQGYHLAFFESAYGQIWPFSFFGTWQPWHNFTFVPVCLVWSCFSLKLLVLCSSSVGSSETEFHLQHRHIQGFSNFFYWRPKTISSNLSRPSKSLATLEMWKNLR